MGDKGRDSNRAVESRLKLQDVGDHHRDQRPQSQSWDGC